MDSPRFPGDDAGPLLRRLADHRFGPVPLCGRKCLAARSGLAISLALGTPARDYPASLFIGLGFSVVIPILFRAGGRTPGMTPGVGIAAVTTMGLSRVPAGTAHCWFYCTCAGLRVGLLLVAVFSAVVSVTSRRVLSE